MALSWLANGGFSDIQPGILPLDEMKEMIDLTAPLKPKYWRIMAAWNFIAHEADPGPSVTSPPSYGDAPYAYAPPTTRNRDWSTVDRCINEIIRRTDAEIILMVGQNRPRYGTHSGGGTSGLFGLFGGFASLVSGGLFGAVRHPPCCSAVRPTSPRARRGGATSGSPNRKSTSSRAHTTTTARNRTSMR
jgi:hypothetical protein